MKIEEKFYTISYRELKWLCRKHSIRFQNGFDDNEFIIFFEDNKDYLVKKNIISELTFSAMVDNVS